MMKSLIAVLAVISSTIPAVADPLPLPEGSKFITCVRGKGLHTEPDKTLFMAPDPRCAEGDTNHQ